MTFLKSQSTLAYRLLKNEKTKLYYIRRIKDKKTVLIGDNDKAEPFILYGLAENKEEIKELFKN